MSILSRAARFLTGAAPAVTGEITAPRPSAAYMRGDRSLVMAGWTPALRDAQDDVSEAWDRAAARATDAIHNSGWLAGAIDQCVANTVGTGLRLKPMPENSLFGMSDADARAWARDVEIRWGLYAGSAQECDIRGQHNFGKIQGMAFRSWLATGEILAELPARKRPWNVCETKVRLLPSTRLSRKSETTRRLINGVYTDPDGMPIGYLATRKDPLLGTVEYDVAARDRFGRPRVMHIFSGPAETYRGIGPLTPALQVARQFDQLADATLTASILQAVFAASIEGDTPTEEVLAGLLTQKEQAQLHLAGISPFEAFMDMQAGYYDASPINLGVNGRIAHLFPGQELKFNRAQGPGPDYEAFVKMLLREIARCLGLLYESYSGDYTASTYASLNAATAEIHQITKARREHVVVPFCQPVYEAWLEEEILTGRVAFPGGYDGFLANRAAACRADWRGPPRPQGDDLKLAKAHQVWEQMGVMSHAMIASDLGVDIEDVYAQRALEKEMREEYDLPDPMAAQNGMGGGITNDPTTDNSDQGAGDGSNA